MAETVEGLIVRIGNQVGKATAEDSPVIFAADRNRTKMGRAFLLAIEALRAREDIRWGSPLEIGRAMTTALEGLGIPASAWSLKEAWQQTYRAGAEAELAALADKPVLKVDIGAELRFDLLNPEAVNFITAYTFGLIREISDETRRGVQVILRDAFQQGRDITQQAREIRQLVGLTERQAQAVVNFRRMLETGTEASLREALTRARRDQRFDSTIQRAIDGAARLPQERIDRMVDRYSERLLRYRSETIARTETARAASAGQQELWRQAESQGLLNRARTQMRWTTARDERTCRYCAPMDGKQVPFGQSFSTLLGTSSGPPLHPSCRCDLTLRFLPR